MGGTIAALVVLGGGLLWFKEHTPADQMAEMCGGVLPVDEMLELTGTTALGFDHADDDLELDTWHLTAASGVAEPEGLSVACRTNTGIEVFIQTADGTNDPYFLSSPRDDALPLPLGAGWTGFVMGSTVSVLLDCPDWGSRQGGGILVTAEAEGGSRATVARLATVAAERTAERTGCGGETGARITRIPGDAGGRKVTTDEATGTCATLRSHSRMRETAAPGTSPLEECVLGEELVLRAFYGTFISERDRYGEYGSFRKPTGDDSGGAWGSATDCQGLFGTAVYELRTIDDGDHDLVSDPLTSAERDDLRRFAEGSAERHGCRGLVLPGA
ncbi:hypothetical protein [Streptomyces sp. TLI_55]|uniref:hypothetical protein n=1 Tax=Streptomyces sp. TLI_55 TaxID=1938861 RepID=UPI00117C28C2|nr:hypothetical protein [Streptomyces sp. TLI_55]